MRYVDTERPTDEQVRLLYQVQEDLYQKISENLSDYDIRLIGGTALSRCYLNHRISFDIYISINPDDRIALKKILALTQIPNVTLLNTSALNDKNYSFSFFRYRQSNLNVEFSVGEDRMFQYYEPSTQVMGNTQVNTVTLKTLYLNKIRTIAGDMPGFARQKLRDVFDVFVLSKECSPISDFLVEIEQKIPFLCQDRFYENLASMPWYDFFSEKIFAIGKWQNFEEIDKLSNALYAEASMEQVDEDDESIVPEQYFFKALSNKHNAIEKALPDWEAVWVSANWSSPIIPLEGWKKAIMSSSAERCGLLENAIEYLPTWGFIKWYGEKIFKQTWPTIRLCCPKRLFKNREIFDMYWAILETGNFRIQPLPEWFTLTVDEQNFLREILKSEGKLVDELLEKNKDNYSMDQLQKLIKAGFLFQDKGRIWRDLRYKLAQAPRKAFRKTFLINGKKKTFTAPTYW